MFFVKGEEGGKEEEAEGDKCTSRLTTVNPVPGTNARAQITLTSASIKKTQETATGGTVSSRMGIHVRVVPPSVRR